MEFACSAPCTAFGLANFAPRLGLSAEKALIIPAVLAKFVTHRGQAAVTLTLVTHTRHFAMLCFHGCKDPSNALCMLSGLLKRTKWNLIIVVPLLALALAERLISTAFLLFTEVTKQQLYIPAAPNLWDDSNLCNLHMSTRQMYHYLSSCAFRFLYLPETIKDEIMK